MKIIINIDHFDPDELRGLYSTLENERQNDSFYFVYSKEKPHHELEEYLSAINIKAIHESQLTKTIGKNASIRIEKKSINLPNEKNPIETNTFSQTIEVLKSFLQSKSKKRSIDHDHTAKKIKLEEKKETQITDLPQAIIFNELINHLGWKDIQNLASVSKFFANTFAPLFDQMRRHYKLSLGALHTLILKPDGTVLGCGSNLLFQLGLNYSENPGYLVPTRIMKDVKQISAGGAQSFFIKKDGSFFGINNKLIQTAMIDPAKITEPRNVAKVFTSTGDMVALTEEGKVWVWGDNQFGQLGLGVSKNNVLMKKIWRPILNPRVANIKDVALKSRTGSGNTFFLDYEGKVFYCGSNNMGPLGIFTPMEIRINQVKQVAAGHGYAIFLKKNGSVWVCGKNVDGAMGLGDQVMNQDILTPVQILELEKVIEVVAGASHTIFLKNDGTVWVCGRNLSGQLGLGDNINRLKPAQIPDLNDVMQVFAGDNHSMFLKKNGEIGACGANDSGQLGLGDRENRYTVTFIESLESKDEPSQNLEPW